MPEKALKKLNTYILPAWKACFFAALVVGLLAHIYKITGWLPNWDSLVFRYDAQNMVALGRWFLPVACSFSSFYDLPFLNGILAIIFHGLGAVCICRMFHIERKIPAACIGAVIVSFPAVTSIMMYNYVADGYSIAFFLSTLAAFYMTKDKPKYLLSALLITLSTGIYQAYITVTIGLILMKLIDATFFHHASFGTIVKKALRMLLSGILGMALYSIILKIILAVSSIELLEYQGVDATASLSNFHLLASLYVIKETFVNFFFDVSRGVNVFVVLHGFVALFVLGFYLVCIIKNKMYKQPLRMLMLIFLSVMLPFGTCALAFINPNVDYHNLMLMGYVVFYLLFLLLYERGSASAIKCWAILITALLMICNQIVIANVSYHNAQMAYEKSYGVLIRIADRIEQTPGNDACEKILVVGALEDSDAYSMNLTPNITGITDGFILRKDDEIVGQSVVTSTLNDYCGKNYTFVSGEEKKTMLQRNDIQAMNTWPLKDCIAIINNTIVIKLGTEGENK